MIKFIINAVKYSAAIAIIPTVGLYLTIEEMSYNQIYGLYLAFILILLVITVATQIISIVVERIKGK